MDWVINSGASFHVTSRADFFTSYLQGEFGNVCMGNEDVSKIVGMGDICLETNIVCKLLLRDVRHVSDIRLNLISTGKLDDEGYNNNFSDGKWKLSKGSLVVAKGNKTCSLYTMQAKICKGVVNTLENDSSTDLWHRRLGHMSEKGLQVLSKKELLAGIKGTPLKTCVHCFHGKQNRISFRRNIASRKSHVLDLVHLDVCGPLKVRTLGGDLYFVTFIDDHSRKVWAYTLKTKDQVLDVFKHFQANVERETGRQLKCVRLDNGGQSIGPFDQYCTNHGIMHEKTVKKILARVRCLLSHS